MTLFQEKQIFGACLMVFLGLMTLGVFSYLVRGALASGVAETRGGKYSRIEKPIHYWTVVVLFSFFVVFGGGVTVAGMVGFVRPIFVGRN